METHPVSPSDFSERRADPALMPLIRTKLFAPSPRIDRVPRPRLIAQLQHTSRYALTLVCAPAGFGKTTLLVDWMAEKYPATSNNRKGIGWLSLDEGDNDPSRFLDYLLAAFENSHPGISSAAKALLQSPQALPPQAILAVLINDLQVLAQPLWLVLDDYQFITNPVIHDSLAFFLERAPLLFHLLIATRSDPPLPLHRLRARNQLLELRGDDLRFTVEEATAFLNQVMALSLSVEDVHTLENRTEGWIAGLQMAALSLRNVKGRADFISDFGGSHRYIFEFLIEEVLNHQPDEIKLFLLQTSILNRLCAPLCDAILAGPHDSQSNLEYLERANLFLVALDEVRCWYRYHHLFADLLKNRLMQFSPDLIPVLHMRASRWYEQEALPEEAIQHAFAGNDLERAAVLVERYTMEILNRGEMASLLTLIQALPEDLVAQHPGLCIQHAWALTFSGQLQQIEIRLKQAEAQVEPGESNLYSRDILGSAAIIRGLLADFTGDMAAAVALARRADALLPPDNYQSRSVVPYVLGDGFVTAGDLEQAAQAYEQIGQIGQKSGNLWTSEVALHKLALVRKLQGKLRAAWELYEEVIRLATGKKGLQWGNMGASYVGMSDLQREWNRLEDARETATRAIAIMERWPSPTDLASGYVSLARTAIACGDLAAAQVDLNQANEIGLRTQLFPATWANLEACQVRLWAANADQAAIRQWVRKKPSDETLFYQAGRLDPVIEREWLTLARGLLALSEPEIKRAARLLGHLAAASRDAHHAGLLIETQALLACACWLIGDNQKASQAISESLSLVQGEGYLRVFLDEGETMGALLADLKQTLSDHPKHEYADLSTYLDQILAAFPTAQGSPAQYVESIPTVQALVEPLSQRELEVLALICQGASNPEIAEKLVVTVNTVKKHNNRIFGKLGVTTRVQAVLKARELGIWPEGNSVSAN